MGTAIDVGDAGQELQQARADAANARAETEGVSGGALPPAAPVAVGSHAGTPRAGARQPIRPPSDAVTQTKGIGDGGDLQIPSDTNIAPPSPAATKAPVEDNTDFWNPTTFMHFVRDAAKGTGQEVADIAPRVAAQMGVLVGRGAAGLMSIADTEVAALNRVWGNATGNEKAKAGVYDTRLADASFKFVDDILKPAVEHWTPERAEATGQGPGSGGIAQAVGSGGEAVPYMAMGHLGIVPMLANATTQSMYDNIDQGGDIKSAYAAGTIDGIATWLQMKFGVIPTKPLLQRVITAIPLGDLIKVSGDYAKKIVLGAMGNHEAADKIDPLANLGEDTVTNAIFGIFGGKGKPKEGTSVPKPGAAPVAPPSPEVTAVTPPPAEAVPPSPSVTPSAPPQPAVDRVATPPPQATSVPTGQRTPDQPGPESAKDLRAQVVDMNDKTTPRQGVLVTPDSQTILKGSKDANSASVTGTLNQARSQGRVVTLPQGDLILKTAKIAKGVNERLAAGEDPQSVIGSVTGAGGGKTPDQTHVVQGKTPTGAVATETMVAPADVPAAVQKVVDQGKTPEVTTPDAAVARRMDEISKERSQPTQMGIMTTPSGKEVAVHVEAGGADGQVRVRAIGEDGEPSDHAVDVPAERVKVSAPKGETAAPTSDVEGLKQPTVAKVEEATPKSTAENKVVPPPNEVEAKPAKETPTVPETPPVVTKEPASAKPVLENANPVEDTSSQAIRDPVKERKIKIAIDEANRIDSLAPEDHKDLNKKLSEIIGRDYKAKYDPDEGFDENDALKQIDEKPEPAKPKAKKIESALESLPKALETHEQQEQIPPGKKFATSLRERQDNASAFAQVLSEAAKNAAGKAPDEAVARATKAARSAERLTEKSKEATDKGQGTGHVKVTALVDEMHKAARGLLGGAREGDEVKVAPKEAEIKAKVEKAKVKITVKPKTEGATAKPKPVVTKPKAAKEVALPPEDALAKVGRKQLDSYIHATNEKAEGKRDEIEQWLHENLGETYTPRDIDKILQLLDDQREKFNPYAKKAGRTMSDTIEDEEHEYDHDPTSSSKVYRPSAPTKLEQIRNTIFKSRLHDEWKALTGKMVESGAYTKLVSALNNTGKHTGVHEFLDTMLQHAHTPVLRDIISTIRAHAPDLPIYHSDSVKSLLTGRDLPSGGLFHGHERAIQIATASDPSTHIDPRIVLQTVIHEVTHAATSYELGQNPGGELATAMENARQVLENRMRSIYGNESIDAHLAHWRDGAAQPAEYMRHLYGLKDMHELAAEVTANPRFVREIAESETFKSPMERGINMGPNVSLLTKIYNAIGKFFGVKDPRLLQHIAGLTERTMSEQAGHAELPGHHLFGGTNNDFAKAFEDSMTKKFGLNPLESRKAFPTFESLREEPPKLRGVDDQLRDTVGERSTATARAFNWALKNKAIDGVRTVVTRLKTMDQIFRDHRSDFGSREDPKNPLNQLEDVDTKKNVLINKMSEITRPVAENWLKLTEAENKTMGQLMIDSTMYKIDPRLDAKSQITEASSAKGFDARHAEYQTRYNKLSDMGKKVFGDAIDANRKIAREMRKAAVDTALNSFTDKEITPAQRSLLYGAKTHEIFDDLIGKDKLIDVGDRNDSLRAALADFAGQTEIAGPYLHLGRQGEYVVSAEPSGTREFKTRPEAEAFANDVNNLSPDSKGTYAERGGKHVVDYTAKYVSMHESKLDAEAAAQKMRDAGYDVGFVTRKTLGRNDTPLGAGARDLVAAAESKINRMGKDKGTEALVGALRSAFLQIAASRSAYASSRLARKNFAGVKPEDMRRNFAEHAQSTIWHAAQLRTVFDQASALARLRDMARDSQDTNASQKVMYRRGEVMKALNEHMQDEVQNFGHKAPLNSALAKLGFMSYLASPSHAFIWMTQNFTTGIPVAGARWGYGKATAAFTKGMMAVAAPSFRATIHAAIRKGGNASDVHEAIINAVKADKHMGKWAQGENSPLQQLIDRGIISHGYSNELGALARGDSATVARAFEWARLLPNMADAFNRVSTALAGLEMTGGDIRKTSDFVREVHADYSQQNKPLLFKKVGRVPGMNSVTMFKTYVQAMSHLTYGNLKESMVGDRKAEAAKTVAGLIVANSLFAGVYAGAALEPLRLAVYAYHKLFDKEGEVYDLQNQVHHWLVDAFGSKAGNVAAGGLPRALGFDLSSRMGLANLFFHEPPDLLTTDKEMWKNFFYQEAGPMASFLAERTTGFVGHMQKGEPFQAISQLVPIKMWQDAVKAYQLATTGKQNSLGGKETEPSMRDAAVQLFGLKPASVAEAQENTGLSVNYNKQLKGTRDAIVKDYVQSNGGDSAQKRLDDWNNLHPAEAIRGKDLSDMMKFREKTEEGAPSRDEDLNAMKDFSSP